MTNKACFVLQIASAVLLILAMIFYMVYCCGVTLPQMRDHYYSNLETGTGMYGVIVILIFMVVAAIYVIFGICGILTGVYMFVISLVLNKKTASEIRADSTVHDCSVVFDSDSSG